MKNWIKNWFWLTPIPKTDHACPDITTMHECVYVTPTAWGNTTRTIALLTALMGGGSVIVSCDSVEPVKQVEQAIPVGKSYVKILDWEQAKATLPDGTNVDFLGMAWIKVQEYSDWSRDVSLDIDGSAFKETISKIINDLKLKYPKIIKSWVYIARNREINKKETLWYWGTIPFVDYDSDQWVININTLPDWKLNRNDFVKKMWGSSASETIRLQKWDQIVLRMTVFAHNNIVSFVGSDTDNIPPIRLP